MTPARFVFSFVFCVGGLGVVAAVGRRGQVRVWVSRVLQTVRHPGSIAIGRLNREPLTGCASSCRKPLGALAPHLARNHRYVAIASQC
jgi:hypothetical protein